MEVRVEAVEQWAHAVSDAWADRLRDTPHLAMCLAAGGTPTPVFAMVTTRPLDWSRCSVVALDEFGGLANHDQEDSCDAMLRRGFIDHTGVGQYRPLRTDGDLEAECADVDAWLDRGIDLVVVGIGVNGHVGMNEPGASIGRRTHVETLHDDTRERCRRYFASGFAPEWGITVGLYDLLNAREVWLVATGADKADIIRTTVVEDVNSACPASLFRSHPNVTMWLDRAAAIHLSSSGYA